MARDKEPKNHKQGKMDKYTTVLPQLTEIEGGPSGPSGNTTILQAIHASRDAIEGKMAQISSEVSLLCQDMRNMADSNRNLHL